MIDWLLKILQGVWRTKQLPKEWKKSILVPVHKKNRKVCNNYRGMSLLFIHWRNKLPVPPNAVQVGMPPVLNV